jgi:hypothetical protein
VQATAAVTATRLLNTAVADTADRPRLRFAQWSDTHVDSHPRSDYRLANAKMKYLVDTVNAELQLSRPDFVIGLGDLVTGGQLAKLPTDSCRALGDASERALDIP